LGTKKKHCYARLARACVKGQTSSGLSNEPESQMMQSDLTKTNWQKKGGAHSHQKKKGPEKSHCDCRGKRKCISSKRGPIRQSQPGSTFLPKKIMSGGRQGDMAETSGQGGWEGGIKKKPNIWGEWGKRGMTVLPNFGPQILT